MASCFVCDKEVTDGVFITLAETFFTKTVFVDKISELIGNEFMVIAREEDQLCRRCASLINKSDKLEVDLMEIHNMIKRFLDFKYNLVPKEDNCSEPDIAGLEFSKDENESGHFEFMELPVEAFTLFDNDKNITDQSSHLKEQALTSNVKSSPIFCDEGNVKSEEENVKLEEKQSTQYSVHDKEFREVKEEHSVEHLNTSTQPDDSATLNETTYNNEIPVNEENPKYLLDEKLDSTKRKVSMKRSVKTDEKCIKMKTEIDSYKPPKKYRSLLPKIVKSEDFLKLASFCIFEPIDPSRIIKINKFENRVTLEEYVETVSETLDSHNLQDSVSNTNKSKNIMKHTSHDSYGCEIYKCDICGKECSTKNRLDMHKTIHEKKVCDFCGRTFNSHYRLKVHRNIHTKQKKFTCNICGKSFIHHSTYWYHRKWHDEPYPYSCEFCKRPFKHSSMLAIHRRKHTGERPYKCSYCPLTFTISTTMKKHEMLHTREYAFTCNVCLKGFTTRSKYVYHMAKMHNKIDENSDIPKRKKRCTTVKPSKKQKFQTESSETCKPANVENLNQYLPLELGDGVEIVVGTEKMRKYNDISIEIINKENSQFVNGEWVVNETVNINRDLPVELGEGVVEFVLGPEEIVLSEDMIIPNNLTSQIDDC